MPTEADTCRKYVVPLLQAVGWDNDPHSIAEQQTITDGRIVPIGKGFKRKPPKRADYLLNYRRDFRLAIVEAKAEYKAASEGMQQAKEYAEMLGLTATPLRDDNRDTYLYFGNPLYEYRLRQGIEDGFLAPYRVHRVITQWDAASVP